MIYIHSTVSLCNKCYRHIPAVVYEEDGFICMVKNCRDHGIQNSIVETDLDFYYGLQHHHVDWFSHVLFEASDRCQLKCPHCYHLPDNKIQDRPIEDILNQLKSFPIDAFPMLAGAEATLRPDFVELCQEIKLLNFAEFQVLSNGLKFVDRKWTLQVYDSGLQKMCLGLNHPSYQGQKVHDKQLKAIHNMIDVGFNINYIGYTIESYEHLPFILKEIRSIHNSQIHHYRIRCGSFIGRSNDTHRSYLSGLVKKIKEITNGEIETIKADDNPYHVMVSWNGILLRLIQWPDVTNIDLEELATGPWCQFYDGPITNFVHQVITRDAYKNMNLQQLDLVPTKYRYQPAYPIRSYWKDDWSGPLQLGEIDWKLESDQTPFDKNIIPILTLD